MTMCYLDGEPQRKWGPGVWIAWAMLMLGALIAVAMFASGCKSPSPAVVSNQTSNAIGGIQERAAAVVQDAMSQRPLVAGGAENIRRSIEAHGRAILDKAKVAQDDVDASAATIAKQGQRITELETQWHNAFFAGRFWRMFWWIVGGIVGLNAGIGLLCIFGGPAGLFIGKKLITGLPAMWGAAWLSSSFGPAPAASGRNGSGT